MRLTILAAAAAIVSLLSAGAAQAGLTGLSVSEAYYFPNDLTPYPSATSTPPSFVVGAGEESVVSVENVTFIHVDFGDDSLALLFNTVLNDPTWLSTSFNGVIFTSPGFGSVTGVSVNPSTTFGGFGDSRVSIVGDALRLDWGGLSYVDGKTINLDFTFSDGRGVPEPATWAMMIAGFGLVGAALRRRRGAVAIAA